MAKRRARATASKYALPTTRSKPSERLEDYSMLIYGEKKIGKTTLCSQYGEAFFFMFEPGGRALSIYQEPFDSWGKFTQFVNLFCASKDFTSGIIDTTDLCFKACQTKVCRDLDVEHPNDAGYGKGWDALSDEFNRWITKRLLMSDKGIVFLSHSQEREVKLRHGGEQTRIGPTMSKRARGIIDATVDIWGYYHYHHGQRVLQIVGDDDVAAGHRLKGRFQYTDGSPIKMIPMGKDEEEAFHNLTAAFNNQLPPPEDPKRKVRRGKKVVIKRRKR